MRKLFLLVFLPILLRINLLLAQPVSSDLPDNPAYP
jgi:hypothetical protein